MKRSELSRLIKVENRIVQIVTEELGLNCYPVEFDVIPPQKMLEIMAYHIPTNISNWKKGRDYERQRTANLLSPIKYALAGLELITTS
jgi:spore cortex formation protein SpoVR/YcgB (stage V sporulation)